MSIEDNKALVRRWLEAVDTGDVAVVGRYLAAAYVDHNPPPFPDLPPGRAGRSAPLRWRWPPSAIFTTSLRTRSPRATW